MRTPVHPIISRHVGAIGNAILTAEHVHTEDCWRDYPACGTEPTRFYWNGPGARLYLMFGDALVRIDHPAADGAYLTVRDAESAVRAMYADGAS